MISDDLVYWFWLRDIKNIGPARAKALIDVFGSPERVYAGAVDEYLDVPGVGKDNAKRISESKGDLAKAKSNAEHELRIAEKINASIIKLTDLNYPALLKEQPAVAPPLLYVRGSLKPLAETVGIVGTRHPSPEGRIWASEFAKRAVIEGWQVISGLAAGIDSAAHQGALEGHGYTIAVLGCGVDRVYPPENKRLFENIIASGGTIISEYPFGTPPMGDNLRKRNKITVALSKALLIAECPLGSGTLIAADEAFEQVKPVFAFPFPDRRKSAQGSQKLVEENNARAITPSTNLDVFTRLMEDYHLLKFGVIFDLDGVLGDTTRLTKNALISAVKQVEGKTLNEEDVKTVIHLSPQAALKQLGIGNPDRLRSAFNDYWTSKYSKDLVAHPQLRGILEKLQKLGMPMGIVTSRNRIHTTSAIDALKLNGLFGTLITWGDTAQHKPHPAPISAAIERMSCKGRAIYIGDLPTDIVASKAAGAVAVGATWFLTEENKRTLEASSPDYLVAQPSELFELVLQLRRQEWSRVR